MLTNYNQIINLTNQSLLAYSDYNYDKLKIFIKQIK